MQYLHQSQYGHIGGVHTAKPVLAMEKGHIYDIKHGHIDRSKPLYVVRENHAFATDHHPDGRSAHALFEIRGDKVHTTVYHPEHQPDRHVFEIKGMMT